MNSATEVTGIESVVARAAQWSKLTVSPSLRRDAVRGTAMVAESTCPDSTVNARTHKQILVTECEHFHFGAEDRAMNQLLAQNHDGLRTSRSVNNDVSNLMPISRPQALESYDFNCRHYMLSTVATEPNSQR
jgi:hypothetical protein